MGFCPQWVFDVCCARAAQEFISLDLDLETYAKKYEKESDSLSHILFVYILILQS